MPAVQLESSPQIEAFIDGVRSRLLDLPLEERDALLQQARARVELQLDLDAVSPADSSAVAVSLAKVGGAAELARKLRAQAPSVAEQSVEPAPATVLTGCRSCKKEVSRDALSCPQCGAPFPARAQWGGRGYEWKSRTRVFGLPLVHVAVGRNEQGKLRVAKGIIAIGQFGIGAITIAQFGIAGIFGIGQFMLAPIALGQFAFGLLAAGQFGIGLLAGAGQFATGWLKAIGMATFGPK